MITDIKELRNDLLSEYQALKEDGKRVKVAKELANLAGKAISTVKLQLEYASLRNEKPKIDFLGGGK